MSAFFINRPIFAWVIAIVIMLGGLLALTTLPISQYPQIAPTTVNISATYPGADAQTVENSVTKVIEQGMTGIDNLDYMTATSTSTGSASITLTFTSTADPDTAQVQTQNKLQLVQSQLPQVVQSNGITVSKSSTGFLMVIGFVSSDGKMNSTDLADYVDATVNDTLKRVEGVGSTQLFGSGYAMRIWLDPDKLAKYALMPNDVASAIEAQNTQVSAGQLGGLPARKGQQLNATVTAKSRLQTAEQFRNIILKSQTDGSLVRLNDVATVELGAESYTTQANYNGKPAAGVAVNLATGANAISTAEAVRSTINRLSSTFPQGVEVVYPYDTSPFVRLSIEEVVKTLAEAIVLVFLVMFIFLQNLRATIIPTIAVPVVLLGTFGVLSLFGYSVNTLTMFAMVLAIGLLVDDAIVVVENVERVMAEEDLSPKEATRKSMNEITGALIGIATVLSAVFVPMAFFGGSTGIIYRQFSVTIVSAMVLSVLVALVLTPALCATILRRPKDHATQTGPFGWFNRMFDRGTTAYRDGSHGIINRSWRFLAVFLAIVVAMGWMFARLPSSFLPEEDQGILITSVQLPVGATQDRTERVLKQVTDHYLNDEKDAVDGVFTASGFGFGGAGQNVGIGFVRLKDFSQRKSPAMAAQAIAGRAMGAFSKIRDAQVFALAPPAIQGFGNTNGFDFYLQDVNGAGHDALIQTRNQLLGLAGQSKLLANTRPNGQEDQPQFSVDIDQEKASALGVSLADINNTLSSAWGSDYVNDFIDRGRVKPVYMQSDANFRMQPEDLDKWQVRNASGAMVPFSAFASSHWTFGSPRLERYNGSAAVEIQGAAAAGVSSGAAMDEIDKLVAQLPAGYSHEWTGLSHQERLSGNQAMSLYAISALVVFLCLAALYESWSIPFAVMLSVPIGIFGALLAASLFGQTNDVYFKVGLLTTIGLAAKNAILIVEFAIERQAAGMGLVEATLEAARQRLRPILMTSLAFILGVTPLAIASGAGSGAQNSVGIGVMGGMIAATVIGVFLVPLLFVTVRRIFMGRVAKPDPGQDTGETPVTANQQ
ncbi:MULTISPECIES: efflux RND transporter permease subunit [unclassified Mesorhizobium]|uniref:efflux RND transporter permease subunit n=1 Tax=unclassified Mesorhizobium TaxID=325217 RepID=UPI000FD90015|nr:MULTISPECIES: efflux RND transporter permease subunit [unclassified Mesorhizobium]TGR47209.1 efflux RND transporter permease subunit [bacterium M00.F.Ca.ET.199.01.1.1]TGU36659.1 efflux RND transporter permease subunit [bacterium M00.F.Ca.ET.156.01.1.1]TGV87847.1 efflux RND transporter permease subunit [Mesorhizobium sp. M00.F.Ca.ET.149.01.1.1]TGR28921.1 efflux RND transporter permease subunit [Mesorhizobium sp. M8A.F.Ca.ET.202.01.1.1]TGR29853.1 efflux RND transporter permease subunit [Mesor